MIQPGVNQYMQAVNPKPQMFFDTGIGTMGDGIRALHPTIPPQYPGSFPRVNLFPKFQIGGYNNAEQSFHEPRFEEYWKDNYYSNNPVGTTSWDNTPGGIVGNAANGQPNGPGYGPNPWSPYNLNDLGVRGGPSQSQPYALQPINLEGGVQHTWNFMNNINQGEGVNVVPPPSYVVVDDDGRISTEERREAYTQRDPVTGKQTAATPGSSVPRGQAGRSATPMHNPPRQALYEQFVAA